ncbi:MAG: hypothetical protein DHS20C18_31810 [Saprospiraceae bacterium]|nr:MAG: hypothetical protein DHS20C18_31810 [Saprospiraceae bacterium]
MNTLQLYKYTSWGLLLLNLSMIAFFFLTKPNPPMRDGARNFRPRGIELLQLDKKQQTEFIGLAEQHNQQMRGLNDQQRNLLEPYFYSLIDSTKMTDRENILNEVQQLERQKIETTFHHFQEVKSILKNEQQADFELFMTNALKVLLLDSERKPHPPKDF